MNQIYELTCKYLMKYSNWMSYKNGKWQQGDYKDQSGYYLVLSHHHDQTKDITKIDAIAKFLNLALEDFKNLLISQGAIISNNDIYFENKRECESIIQAFKLQNEIQLFENIILGV